MPPVIRPLRHLTAHVAAKPSAKGLRYRMSETGFILAANTMPKKDRILNLEERGFELKDCKDRIPFEETFDR